MDLSNKRCVPCEGGIAPLKKQETEKLLKQVPGWTIKNGHLNKDLKFKDFKQALGFTVKVGKLAEQEAHHPDISISYNKVELDLYTHAINGLSENDFILAAKINKVK